MVFYQTQWDTMDGGDPAMKCVKVTRGRPTQRNYSESQFIFAIHSCYEWVGMFGGLENLWEGVCQACDTTHSLKWL